MSISLRLGVILTLATGLSILLTGCLGSEQDVRRIVIEEIATAVASIPTASPQPTATAMVLPPTPTSITFPTPLPTATPVTFPPTATPQPTPTPQPTATPRALPPTPTPRPTPTTVPSGTTSGSTGNGAISVEPGNPALTIEPTLPVAGRDINFTMTGLPPWQQVSVGFIDPLGEPAEWIDKNEFLYTWTDGQPVVDRTLFADGSGEVSWLRIGTNDVDGVWSVRLEAGDQSSLSNYALTQIQLPEQPTETIGIQMRHYRGSLSDTYYSALVPSSVAVDLQAHLGWVIKQLSEVQGIQSLQIPDIYLAGNENLFSELAAATGTFVGFEDGFYRRSGNRPGIYIRTDTFRADLQALLTHEYVHLVLDEIASGRSLPSWLNEGLAKYIEIELGLIGERPNATKFRLYRAADLVKQAALDGDIINLPDLESQESWNSQTSQNRISLQYAEAYMAISYLTETYGDKAALGMIKSMGRGLNLPLAIEQEIQFDYIKFQNGFYRWLESWQDQEREEVRVYLDTLDEILGADRDISRRRTEELGSNTSFFQPVPAKEELLADAQALLDRLGGTRAPSNADGLIYLNRNVQWLALELEFVQTGQNSKINQANQMIPKINGREGRIVQDISDLKVVYNLE